MTDFIFRLGWNGVGFIFKSIKNPWIQWANPGLFSIYFRSIQTNIVTIFTANKCEKCPSSMRCRDSNSQPYDSESPPLTTRPGIRPRFYIFLPWCLGISVIVHNKYVGIFVSIVRVLDLIFILTVKAYTTYLLCPFMTYYAVHDLWMPIHDLFMPTNDLSMPFEL